MTRAPDAKIVQELMEQFTPAAIGILSPNEKAMIRDKLELDYRTNIEVQNARDMTVLLHQAASSSALSAGQSVVQVMNKMSAIVAVIDEEKSRRGMPV